MKEKKLNCKKAKKISIREYLNKLGEKPKREFKSYGMYRAFWREEKSASVKIDYNLNLFYDFGTSESGDIINLVQLINKCNVSNALTILESNTFSFEKQFNITTNKTPNYTIDKIVFLENKYLLDYLKSRKINLEIAQKYCSQVHYSLSNKKQYYGIAFKNNNEGFEIRNKYFKGCLGRKDITTIYNYSNTVCVFESFSDFLAYKTLQKNEINEDYIITNSTVLVKKCVELIKEYKSVKTYFDNDQSGRNSNELIEQNCNTKFIDCSSFYKMYKDLNEYLIKR